MKVELAPGLDQFVSDKVQSGDYHDANEVIQESLRRWKENEQAVTLEPDGLEQEIQEGFDSPDLRGGKGFWKDLSKELHRGHRLKNGNDTP